MARATAAGIKAASGDCITHVVAPLTRHHRIGTGRSSHFGQPLARTSTPSVPTTVGSGARLTAHDLLEITVAPAFRGGDADVA
jgi:hypothetical protein